MKHCFSFFFFFFFFAVVWLPVPGSSTGIWDHGINRFTLACFIHPTVYSRPHPRSLFVGVLQGFLKVRQRRSLEDGSHQTAEVSAHTAEGQAKVHTLPQQGVQSTPNASVQVCFQRGQELRHLQTRTAVTSMELPATPRYTYTQSEISSRHPPTHQPTPQRLCAGLFPAWIKTETPSNQNSCHINRTTSHMKVHIHTDKVRYLVYFPPPPSPTSVQVCFQHG